MLNRRNFVSTVAGLFAGLPLIGTRSKASGNHAVTNVSKGLEYRPGQAKPRVRVAMHFDNGTSEIFADSFGHGVEIAKSAIEKGVQCYVGKLPPGQTEFKQCELEEHLLASSAEVSEGDLTCRYVPQIHYGLVEGLLPGGHAVKAELRSLTQNGVTDLVTNREDSVVNAYRMMSTEDLESHIEAFRLITDS